MCLYLSGIHKNVLYLFSKSCFHIVYANKIISQEILRTKSQAGMRKLSRLTCEKSVQIRSYFWSVFSCIRTEYRKMRTRNNSVFGHFSRNVRSLLYFLRKYESSRTFRPYFRLISTENDWKSNRCKAVEKPPKS